MAQVFAQVGEGGEKSPHFQRLAFCTHHMLLENHGASQVLVLMSVIPATRRQRSGGSGFEASLGK
jgi:hypothetical protein